MGHKYQAIQWNGNKLVYDAYVVIAGVAFLGAFFFVGLAPHPSGHAADPVVLAIRALGSAAFVFLTIILAIGPLARLSRRFLPLLYNRRHLGVFTFLIALAHFGLATLWYHGGGPLNPLVSLIVSGQPGDPFPGVPFELLGLAAFAILFVMASTSHDFFLNHLGAPVWKAIHMGVYIAYGLIVLHVAYGYLATEAGPLAPALVYGSFTGLAGLHVASGLAEWRKDGAMSGRKGPFGRDWIEIGDPTRIPDGCAVIAPLPRGDRVAIFRDGRSLYAVQNACRHQNGPLGEGALIDGLITCPWHGWQYSPRNGVSPAPFSERIATHDLRLESGVLFVSARPNPLGREGATVAIGGAIVGGYNGDAAP
ncbi:MAG: Rieske 2Fe-2S domain-containing protein [Alphaproteobacteria bacterium]|nr:Rieske 2Fe-2S domain-containing protein [Alphaproteobacteria bacterium]